MEVTPEDVSRVLDEYLAINQASVLEYVPWGFAGAPSAAEMRDHLDAILVASARDFLEPEFPATAAGVQPMATRQAWSDSLTAGAPDPATVSEFELPGGGRLVVQENPVAPTAAVGIWFRGGRIAEQPNFVGVIQVMQRVMLHETFNRSQAPTKAWV